MCRYLELEPVLVQALVGVPVVHVEAAGHPTHMAALTAAGEVWTWGGGFAPTVQHFHHPTCVGQLLSQKVGELSVFFL